ncbi:MAG: aminoglycoside phosphotransferase family protein [Treponema sp.]|nr:aminoglycoside phosphotransferase family protein [Treponema sp.]
MTFDGTQKEIGKGAQAKVLSYQGFAYKLYDDSYPAEWIAFEKKQQQAVNKAGLSSVKYYDTDDSHIIKMDLVEGEQLEKSVPKNPGQGFALLARAFRFVHQANAENTTIPPLAATAGLMLSDEEKSQVLPVIERLSQKYKSCICHLDMHFLNIMIPPDAELIADKTPYTIIDWMNARVAPPVFDYARTYVILDEFAKMTLDYYKAAVWPDVLALGISEEDFFEAVKVCTILRQKEKS